MKNKNSLFKLTGKVQHYQWGGSSFLPSLLNIPNMDGNPFAEYWLGAHDNFPAAIEGAEPQFLNEYVQENSYVLGTKVEFLNLTNNMCSIYEVRPADCSGFPHLTKKKMVDYIHVHKQNIQYCPATYKMVEKMKGLLSEL